MWRLKETCSHLVTPSPVTGERESVAPRPSRKYEHAEPFSEPLVLPFPPLRAAGELELAKDDLTEYGMCTVAGGMTPELLERCRAKLVDQTEAEGRMMAERFGKGGTPTMTGTPTKASANGRWGAGALTNKGAVFLDLVEHPAIDELCGYVLGRSFLLSSAVGGGMRGVGDGVPQPLHRDAGFVPASATFAAVLNVFFLLDDFTAENGGTHLVPGSHRWPEEHSVKPPARETVTELIAPAGSIFAFDGRVFHGTGLIQPGAIPDGVVGRRHLGYNFCLPWVRQQENWGVSLLNEVRTCF